MRTFTLFCLFCLMVSTLPSPALAKRVALVIGNNNYQNVTRLQKAVNDANSVAKTMRKLGFQVIKKLNANRTAMTQQLDRLSTTISPGDEVLFFFAGHGISLKGQNYLLPTNVPKIKPGQERAIKKEAFSEDEIIDILRERGAKVSILIIDACRNNPFPKSNTRSVGRSIGLDQRANPPRNTFIIYSAGIGEEALDRLSNQDKNPNSVFTRKLLPLLTTPGLSHVKMAKRLQIEVEELALSTPDRHQQFPAFYDQVRGEYFLVPQKPVKQPPKITRPITPVKPQTPNPIVKTPERKAAAKQQVALAKPKAPAIIEQPTTNNKRAIADHITYVRRHFKNLGYERLMFVKHFKSCEGCVPFITYCRPKITSAKQLKSLRVVTNRYASNFIKKHGGKPVQLHISEVLKAVELGVVDCKIIGGGPPTLSARK